MGSIPGLGICPRKGNGNPLQYPCLGNPMDRGAWETTVHGVAKSQKRLSLQWLRIRLAVQGLHAQTLVRAKIVSLPNSAHVQSHSSAALSRESELWCPHQGEAAGPRACLPGSPLGWGAWSIFLGRRGLPYGGAGGRSMAGPRGRERGRESGPRRGQGLWGPGCRERRQGL